MNSQVDVLMEKAIELAERPYAIKEYEDTLTNGQKIVLLKHPELRGCMAHGINREEAEKELKEARIAYIHSLLLDNQEVPEPKGAKSFTAGSQVSYISGQEGGKANVTWEAFEQVLEKVIQPEHRKPVARSQVV